MDSISAMCCLKRQEKVTLSGIVRSTYGRECYLVPGFIGPRNCRWCSETAEICRDKNQSPDLDRSVKAWTPAHEGHGTR